MPKAQKVEAVERLKVEFRDSQAALLTSFRGLKVAEMTELRRSLAASQTDFKVVKNTLARIAARDATVTRTPVLSECAEKREGGMRWKLTPRFFGTPTC